MVIFGILSKRSVNTSSFYSYLCHSFQSMPAGKTSARDSASPPPPSKKVKWPVEDPSEYRPLPPEDTSIGNMGKEQEMFRTFYDVSHAETFPLAHDTNDPRSDTSLKVSIKRLLKVCWGATV